MVVVVAMGGWVRGWGVGGGGRSAVGGAAGELAQGELPAGFKCRSEWYSTGSGLAGMEEAVLGTAQALIVLWSLHKLRNCLRLCGG